MGYRQMFTVRSSGMTDRTQVDVLEAIAFFFNEKTGQCYPSTDELARISRVNSKLVRKTVRELEEAGLVSCRQQVGCPRYFTLHLEALPPAPEKATVGQVYQPHDKTTPLDDCHPLEESAVRDESTVTPGRKIPPTPVGKSPEPRYETTPEQGIEQGIEQGKEQGSIARDAKTPCLDTNPNPAQFDGVPFPDFEEASDDELFAEELIKADKAKAELAPEPEAKPKTRTRKTTAKKADAWPVEDDGVDAETREAYLAVRKAKRVGPFTPKAYEQLAKQATKHGVSVKVALEKCIERGWIFPYDGAFEKEKNYGKTQQSQQKSAFLRPQSEIDYTYGLDRWNRA